MAERLKIVMSGMLAGEPGQGGASWAVLQYLLGLRELGHEVMLVEPVTREALARGSRVSRYFRSLALPPGSAALLAAGGRETLGVPFDALAAFAADADLLLNVSGMLREQRLIEPIGVRAFLDLDPGFNQAWHEQGEDMGLDLHSRFVTVGARVGMPGCPVATCGRRWTATLPPVVLSRWPRASEPPRRAAFTTVGHWRSYGSLEHAGTHYGQRAHSLRRLIDLPRRTRSSFELALGIHPEERADLRALAAHGWRLVDPARVAAAPGAYGEFVRGSKAELCVAKGGYVDSRGGWFSDRSACYLASGRPVVAQDTGFGETLPTGEGLLSFTTVEQAAAAVEEVDARPGLHGAAARALAEEHLDSRVVLTRLLDVLGGMP